MLNAPAQLWLSQAYSDYRAGEQIYMPQDGRTYCHAIAKYQQTLEKSIKALAAGLEDAGISGISRTDYYKHNPDQLVVAIHRSIPARRSQEIHNKISNVLSFYYRQEIAFLCAFAPRRPGKGGLHARNTAYPYESSTGVWTAPALPGAFRSKEVERSAALAKFMLTECSKIISALRRLK